MTVEYLGERIFLEEIKAGGELWVARNMYRSVYAVEIDHTGFSLPVWSSALRVASYLKNARLVGPKHEPCPVPVETFITTWLADKAKGIVELQINPDGKSPRVLVMSPEEFLATQQQ